MIMINKTYTIHYDEMTDEQWDILGDIYAALPGFIGYPDNIPSWFDVGDDEGKPKGDGYLSASVEPSGLQVFGYLPTETWDQWDTMFMMLASQKLGFPVRDAEE